MGRIAVERRFMNLVKKQGDCWLWQGYLYHGYGKFRVNTRLIAAHRWAYEMFIGEIPEDMEVHHECGVRNCVNPNHLRAVSGAENKHLSPTWLGNRSHCKRGHELTLIYGQRQCVICRRESDRLSHQRRRQEKRLANATESR